MRALLAILFAVLLLMGNLLWFPGESSSRTRDTNDAPDISPELIAEERDSIPLVQPADPGRSNLAGFRPEVIVAAAPRLRPASGGLGRLRVRVDQNDERVGKPSVRLVLFAMGREDDEDVRLLDISKGNDRNAVLTDSLGQAVLEVPAGLDWKLLAWEEATGGGRRELLVPALSVGEKRDVRFIWEQDKGVEVLGMVTEAGTDRAIVNAQVVLMSAGVAVDECASNANGEFGLWAGVHTNTYLRVLAEGYSPQFSPLGQLIRLEELGYAPFTSVQMNPQSSLEVSVFDEHGEPAEEGLSIALKVNPKRWPRISSARNDPYALALEFEAPLDASGRALFEGIPANAYFKLEVNGLAQGPRMGTYVPPGKRGQLDVTLKPSARASIRGSLTDPAGVPIAGQELWLVASEDYGRYFDCTEVVMRSTRSGKAGAYAFENLIPGTYLVGPSPDCPGRAGGEDGKSQPMHEVAPMGTSVLAVAGQTQILPLSLSRGSYLKLKLVDQENRPVAVARIATKSSDFGGQAPLQFDGDRFVLGPLVQAEHDLQARHPGEAWSSEWVRAEPEDGEQVLRLLPINGVIKGVVWDADLDQPVGTWVHLVPRDELLFERDHQRPNAKHALRVHSQEGTGFFEFHGLVPGEYSLSAFSDGSILMDSIPLIVPLGAQSGLVDGVRLTLQPAAWVTFSRSKGEYGLGNQVLEIRSEGSLLRRVFASEIRSGPIRLPPGRLRFSLLRLGEEFGRSKEIELAPGEQGRVSL